MHSAVDHRLSRTNFNYRIIWSLQSSLALFPPKATWWASVGPRWSFIELIVRKWFSINVSIPISSAFPTCRVFICHSSRCENNNPKVPVGFIEICETIRIWTCDKMRLCFVQENSGIGVRKEDKKHDEIWTTGCPFAALLLRRFIYAHVRQIVCATLLVTLWHFSLGRLLMIREIPLKIMSSDHVKLQLKWWFNMMI